MGRGTDVNNLFATDNWGFDVVDPTKDYEQKALARKSDMRGPRQTDNSARGSKPGSPITNQPMNPYEKLQMQRELAAKQKEAEDKKDEDVTDEIEFEAEKKPPGLCTKCIAGMICIPFRLLISATQICCRIKHVNGYEEAVIFRKGERREISANGVGAGYFCIFPCVDVFNRVDMRTVMFELPEQYLVTKDIINVCIDGLVYYRVTNALAFIEETADPAVATKNFTQIALRRVISTRTVDQIFEQDERDDVEEELRDEINRTVRLWGLEIERVYIKDILIPERIQEALEELAESKVSAKIKIEKAEAEFEVAKRLKAAADEFGDSKSALEMRYVDALKTITERNSSVMVYPMSFDQVTNFLPLHNKGIKKPGSKERKTRSPTSPS